MAVYPDLMRAIQFLAERCDYATSLDGVGFNGTDAKFGHTLAGEASWSPRMAFIAWRMILKYRKQLSAIGIDPSKIPCPVRQEGPTGGRPAPPPPRRVVRIPDGFGLAFAYDPELVAAVKVMGNLQGKYRPRWNPGARRWEIGEALVQIDALTAFAEVHGFVFEESAAAGIEAVTRKAEETVAASKAADAEFDVPGLGGVMYPFQRAGVKYAVEKRRVLIADEMGLGKTVQALATIHALDAYPAIVVCPASLKLNWKREAEKWLPGKNVVVLNGRKAGQVDVTTGKLPDVYVINYDVLGKRLAELKAVGAKAVVYDESHYVKNYRAARSKAAKDLAWSGPNVRLLLSGTPILNRPSELITQLEILGRLGEFGGFWSFVGKYCPQIQGGRDAPSLSNGEDLNQRLRATCFVRRMKSEVLTELPPKQRSIVPFELDNRAEYDAADEEFMDRIREAQIEGIPTAEHLVRIEALKQLAARGKIGAVKEWVESFLETGEKLVIFAHHHEIVDALSSAFPESAVLRGDNPDMKARQAAVDRFQNDESCRLFIGSLQAAGVGITLTAASNVAFVELAWRPADHDQAEDRTHRIGQKNAVNAWYLLAPQTIDDDIQELLEAKRSVVAAATDGRGEDPKAGILSDLIARLTERAKAKGKKGVA